MITYTYKIVKRPNTYRKTRQEWALDLIPPKGSSWTLTTYEAEPTQDQIKRDLEIFSRSSEIHSATAHRILGAISFVSTTRRE